MVKKGQASIEFIILIGVVLFFFLTFSFFIQSNVAKKSQERQNLILKDVALTVQDEINLASKSSDGYYRTFELPEKIVNQDYEINLTEGVVYARTVDGKNAIALPIAEVLGEVKKEQNIIKKENGEVKLNV